MNDAVLNMKMPKELYEELKKAAQEKNISVSALVRLICSEYLKQNK